MKLGRILTAAPDNRFKLSARGGSTRTWNVRWRPAAYAEGSPDEGGIL